MAPAVDRRRRRVARGGGLVLLLPTLGGCALAGTMAPRGNAAVTANRLWWYMLVLGGGITVLWLVLFVVGLARRHPGEADPAADTRIHRRFIVGGGLILPAVALGSLFVLTLGALDEPAGAGDVVIRATGHRFWWEFAYDDPGFVTANELYIPTGTDVQVQLTTGDVIHSFWVPQLAGKRDMVPDRVNALTLHATEPGRYLGACAEYCGIQHAMMRFEVVAVTPDEYAAWLDRMARPAAAPDTPAERSGYDTFMSSSCVACHAIRGTPADGRVGPALTHFASRRLLGAGAAPNEPAELGSWVVDAHTLKPGNLMPPVEVDAAALPDLLTYLESLE